MNFECPGGNCILKKKSMVLFHTQWFLGSLILYCPLTLLDTHFIATVLV